MPPLLFTEPCKTRIVFTLHNSTRAKQELRSWVYSCRQGACRQKKWHRAQRLGFLNLLDGELSTCSSCISLLKTLQIASYHNREN